MREHDIVEQLYKAGQMVCDLIIICQMACGLFAAIAGAVIYNIFNVEWMGLLAAYTGGALILMVLPELLLIGFAVCIFICVNNIRHK